MSYSQALRSIITTPSLLSSKKHLFLLSHMRANTSLMGHLLGSHKQINGYYEMHIGYYSLKSLMRQKILYSQEHSIKKNSIYMFDKVLHNEHYISERIQKHPKSHFLISIRAPEFTIPSVVSLYQKINPGHEFTNPEFAAAYYCERLNLLADIASVKKFNYLYFDADAIKSKPALTLQKISQFLELETPLSTKYEKMHNTGKEKAGDSSSSLLAGEIIQSELIPAQVPYSESQYFRRCQSAYNRVRILLDSKAQQSVLL
ncbi:conserved hypothetical protein [Alteromonas infernus]